ncbi:MAG: hypothetical protein MHM6MM_003677 [Cercozoa sp. M6MM]
MRIAATSEAEPLDLSHVFSQQCTLSLLSTPPVSPPPVLSEHIQLSVEARRSLRRKLVQVEGEVTLAPVPTVRVPTVQDQTQFAALATTKTVDAPVEGRYDASDAALLRRMRQHVEERRRALEAERRLPAMWGVVELEEACAQAEGGRVGATATGGGTSAPAARTGTPRTRGETEEGARGAAGGRGSSQARSRGR